MSRGIAVGVWVLLGTVGVAAEPSAERGKEFLLGRNYNPPFFSRAAYDNVWKQWGIREKPADYERVLRERYGLHAAPYANGGGALGLREEPPPFGPGQEGGDDDACCPSRG